MSTKQALRVAALIASLAIVHTGSSHAITLTDPSIIQAVRTDEPYGATFWNYTTGSFSAVSSSNGSRGSASTVLGQSPTITGEVTTGSTGYVSVSNKLIYQLAYFNPSGSQDTLNVSVNAFDRLLAQGEAASGGYFRSYAWSQLSLLGPGSDTLYTRYHCQSASTSVFYQPCSIGSAPIEDFTVTLRQNTVYTVQMQLYAEANAYSVNASAVGTASALLDPSFAVIGAAPVGGTFMFSAGVSAVPEPQSWATLLAGLACLSALAGRTAAARRRGAADPRISCV